jgi:CRISPR system Cascade subunit CasC
VARQGQCLTHNEQSAIEHQENFMSRFIQLHVLTSYPPANLNRDDLGRPKTAQMGGVNRLRISSQSLKRAWRTSDEFKAALDGHIGTRTKEMGIEIYTALLGKNVSEKNAREWAKAIAQQFGKLKSEKKTDNNEDLRIEQLAHFSPEERTAVHALVEQLAKSGQAPTEDDLKLLRAQHSAVDIALFGRMLASFPAFNTEAAAQVAHAITVHQAQVEDDYFTAVDDLNNGKDDLGAAHIGESGFGAGVFYLYVCINRELLEKNLGGKALADKALEALLHAITKVSPTGKQNSFGSRAYASYALAERGDQQPRSLSLSFLKPVRSQDVLTDAIKALTTKRENMEKAYGACADVTKSMNAETGEGSLAELTAFVTE